MTRRHFIGAAGAAGVALLGAPAVITGCARESGKMNAIVVILDSLRRDHLGAYGNVTTKTPNLDALARESFRFTRPYPDAIPTVPARRAIHTGMRTFPFQEWQQDHQGSANYGWSPLPDDQRTLSEILGDAGYTTAFVTDTWHMFYMNFGRGFHYYDRIRGQEDDPYRDPDTVPEKWMRDHFLVSRSAEKARQYLANVQDRKTEEEYFAPRVFAGGMDLLETVSRRAEPFFLLVDSYDPHEPWDPPKKYVDLYDAGYYDGKEPLYPKYGKSDYLTSEELLRMRALYSAEITMADHWLGNFLQKADELRIMDNTLLVLISDHGHALGEHGYTGKPSLAMWPEITDIAFMIRYPEGRGAGEESDYFASTYDVAPTVLGTLGVDPPYPLDGQNLSALLDKGEIEQRKHFTTAFHNYVWTRDERWVMFSRHDGSESRLYDVANDPYQHYDLVEAEPDEARRLYEDYFLKDAQKVPTPR